MKIKPRKDNHLFIHYAHTVGEPDLQIAQLTPEEINLCRFLACRKASKEEEGRDCHFWLGMLKYVKSYPELL